MFNIITKRLLLLIIFSVAIIFINNKVQAQQDILTSQHLFNRHYINPAHAGGDIRLKASGFFRSRWAGVKNAPTTYMISVDSSIPMHNKAGVGIIGGSQDIGPFNTIFSYADFSYSIILTSNSTLRLGIGLGLSQYSYDGRHSDPGPIDDPVVTRAKVSMMIPDSRIGLLYEIKIYEGAKELFLGLSADNIISPFMNYSKDPQIILPKKNTNIYAYGGYTMSVGGNFMIMPTITASGRFDSSPLWLEGTLKGIFTNTFSAGVSYRTYIQTGQTEYSISSSFIAFTEILAIKDVSVGYAFDMGMGDSINNGTHEIYLRYSFNGPNIISSSENSGDDSSSTNK